MTRRSSGSKIMLGAVTILLLLLAAATVAQASHFRGGTLSWGPLDEEQIVIRGQLAYRYSFFWDPIFPPDDSWRNPCHVDPWMSYPIPYDAWPQNPLPPILPPGSPDPWPEDPLPEDLHEEWPDDPIPHDECPEALWPDDPRPEEPWPTHPPWHEDCNRDDDDPDPSPTPQPPDRVCDIDDDEWPGEDPTNNTFTPQFVEGDVVCPGLGFLSVENKAIDFCLHIIRIDEIEDWFLGQMILPGSNFTDGIPHTPEPEEDQRFLNLTWNDNARLGSYPGGGTEVSPNNDDHVNNPGTSMRLESIIDVQKPFNGAPNTQLVPVRQCVQNTICTLRIPAWDLEMDEVAVRFATPGEPGGGFQQPPGAELSPAEFDPEAALWWTNLTFDTRRTWLNPLADRTFFSTQVIFYEPGKDEEEGDERTKVPLDFMIQIVDPRELPEGLPEWNSYQVPANDTIPPTHLPDHDTFEVTPCGTLYEINVGERLTFGINATHPFNVPLLLSNGGLPPGATAPGPPRSGQVSTTFNWTPELEHKATRWLIAWSVQADDKGLPEAGPCVIRIIVKPDPNIPPVASFLHWKPVCGPTWSVSFANQSFDEDGIITDYKWDFGHADASPANWTGKDPPPVHYPEDGTYRVRLSVTDDGIPGFYDRPWGEPVTITYEVWVDALGNHNHAPVMTPISDQVVPEGGYVAVVAKATDIDCDSLTYFAIQPMPPGSTFLSAAKLFEWKPKHGQAGEYWVTLGAIDPSGDTSTSTFKITVEPRKAPVIIEDPLVDGDGNPDVSCPDCTDHEGEYSIWPTQGTTTGDCIVSLELDDDTGDPCSEENNNGTPQSNGTETTTGEAATPPASTNGTPVIVNIPEQESYGTQSQSEPTAPVEAHRAVFNDNTSTAGFPLAALLISLSAVLLLAAALTTYIVMRRRDREPEW